MTRVLGKAREYNSFLHFDTDDLLNKLYEDHKLYDTYKERNLDKVTNFVYENCHLVTVTQHKFAERIKKHCKAMIGVIKNAIDYDLPNWNMNRKDFPSKRVRIGWAGGIHHIPDVRVFSGVPSLVNQRVGIENVQWDFYGHPPPNQDESEDWQVETWRDYVKVIMKGFKGKHNYKIHYALPTTDYVVM